MQTATHEDHQPGPSAVDDDSLGRLSQWLLSRLEYCSQAKKRDFEQDWISYDNMAEAKYLNAYDDDLDSENWKSQLYYNIAEQKRRSAIVQLQDAIGSSGKFPFSISQTPVSESPTQINEVLKQMGIDLDKALKDAEQEIDDHLLESKSYKDLIKSIADASQYGSGILESPYVYQDKKAVLDMDLLGAPEQGFANDGQRMLPQGEKARDEWLTKSVIPKIELVDAERVGVRRIRPADYFPDPACEGDSQKGFGVFKRSFHSIHTLRKMADETIDLGEGNVVPKYNRAEIAKVLKANDMEAAKESAYTGSKRYANNRFSTDGDSMEYLGIPVYTFYGDVLRKDVSNALNAPSFDPENDDLSDYDTISVIVDFTKDGNVLRAIQNPHPSGLRPIHIWHWEEIDGRNFGRGIFEKLRGLQEEFNRFLTTWIDNKILSANVIIGIVASKIDTERGVDTSVRPGKIIFLREGEKLRDSMDIFEIPDRSDAFLRGFEELMMLIDFESGIPKIVQGQADVVAKTAFETQQRESHALKQLGSVVKNLDEAVIMVIEMIYQRLLVYGEGNNRIHGDFKIHATGFATFESKRVKMQEIDTLLQMAMSLPEFKAHFNIRKLLEQKVKLIGSWTQSFMNTPEEAQAALKQMAEAESNRIQSEIQSKMTLAQADAQAKAQLEEMRGMISKTLADAKMAFDAEQNDRDRDLSLKEKLIDIEAKSIGVEEKSNAQ